MLELWRSLIRYPQYLMLLMLSFVPLILYFSTRMWMLHVEMHRPPPWGLQRLLLLSLLPPQPCIHGYLSAADRYTCVCNSGWAGPSCDVDMLPSCNRGAGQPCLGDLRFSGPAENQTCECVRECVEHTMSVMRRTFGDKG